MRKLLLGFMLGLALLLAGCTENSRSRSLGGSATVDLPVRRKLVTATWKETSLWILTRPMREGEVAETYQFEERSALGLLEGTVILKERQN